MSSPQTPGTDGLGAAPVACSPVACSLGAGDLAAQAGRWIRLISRAMIERTETGSGVRITFRRGAGTEEELRALTAVENECCSWATWTVAGGDSDLVLDVSSDGEGVAALHAMFTG